MFFVCAFLLNSCFFSFPFFTHFMIKHFFLKTKQKTTLTTKKLFKEQEKTEKKTSCFKFCVQKTLA